MKEPIPIQTQQLPLYCPSEKNDLWQMHPRVFLPLDKTGRASCPYCGAVYCLIEKSS